MNNDQIERLLTYVDGAKACFKGLEASTYLIGRLLE
jgi:hypothetical protein